MDAKKALNQAVLTASDLFPAAHTSPEVRATIIAAALVAQAIDRFTERVDKLLELAQREDTHR